uniref:Integrase core domain containing protein n=1 Tax=Solanum tuberosum TaxID=4113 RepID=M1DF02_SOLTU
MKACRSPSSVGESPIGQEITFCSSVLSPEWKDQVVDEMEQSACCRVFQERGRKTKTTKLIVGGIGSTWVQLERMNPSPFPTHSAPESEWAKAEFVLNVATQGGEYVEQYSCENGVSSIRSDDIPATFKQLEDERIYKSWARFKELITHCPTHDIPDIALLDCFYRSLGPGIKMDELAKTMVEIEVQCKRKDKYIIPHKGRRPKDNEVKRIEGMLSIILHKVTEQDRELEEMKKNIKVVKQMIGSHSKSVQLLENLMGHALTYLYSQKNRGLSSDTMANLKKEIGEQMVQSAYHQRGRRTRHDPLFGSTHFQLRAYKTRRAKEQFDMVRTNLTMSPQNKARGITINEGGSVEQPFINRRNELRARPQSTSTRVSSAATPLATDYVPARAPPVTLAPPVAPPPRLQNRLKVRTILEGKFLSTEGLEGKYPDVRDTINYHEFEQFTRPRGPYIPSWVWDFYIAYGELVPKKKEEGERIQTCVVGHCQRQ